VAYNAPAEAAKSAESALQAAEEHVREASRWLSAMESGLPCPSRTPPAPPEGSDPSRPLDKGQGSSSDGRHHRPLSVHSQAQSPKLRRSTLAEAALSPTATSPVSAAACGGPARARLPLSVAQELDNIWWKGESAYTEGLAVALASLENAVNKAAGRVADEYATFQQCLGREDSSAAVLLRTFVDQFNAVVRSGCNAKGMKVSPRWLTCPSLLQQGE